MTIDDLGMLTASAKIHYLCTLLCGEELRQFDTFCDQLGSTNTAHVSRIVLGVGTHSFPVDTLSKQKCVMHRGMRKPRKLKVRH